MHKYMYSRQYLCWCCLSNTRRLLYLVLKNKHSCDYKVLCHFYEGLLRFSKPKRSNFDRECSATCLQWSIHHLRPVTCWAQHHRCCDTKCKWFCKRFFCTNLYFFCHAATTVGFEYSTYYFWNRHGRIFSKLLYSWYFAKCRNITDPIVWYLPVRHWYDEVWFVYAWKCNFDRSGQLRFSTISDNWQPDHHDFPAITSLSEQFLTQEFSKDNITTYVYVLWTDSAQSRPFSINFFHATRRLNAPNICRFELQWRIA